MKQASIIIPCHNEEAWVGSCLDALLYDLLSSELGDEIEVIAVLNGCTDGTSRVVNRQKELFDLHTIEMQVVTLETASKARALNHGDEVASGKARIYLDADVRVSIGLVGQLMQVLSEPRPTFASGHIRIPPPTSFTSRCYARLWTNLPFVSDGVSGCGLYGVSEKGRRRWTTFPIIHSDDKFARLHFSIEERKAVASEYFWPLPEGLGNLIRVRRRWCEGNRELAFRFPNLVQEFDHSRSFPILLRLTVKMPLSIMIFATVYLLAAVLSWWKPCLADEWRTGRNKAPRKAVHNDQTDAYLAPTRVE